MAGDSNMTVTLRLYVSGQGPRSIDAIRASEEVVRRLGTDACTLDVIDVAGDPVVAERDQVLATPMLVRVSPEPYIRVIGGVREAGEIMAALQLHAGAGERA